MKSIHRRLSIGILPCFAILWVIGSVAVYVSVEKSLTKTLDTELAFLMRPIRHASMDGRHRPQPRKKRAPSRRSFEWLEGVGEEGSGTYYQMWDMSGESSMKSPSLGKLALEFPERIDAKPLPINRQLSNGDRIRVVATSGPSGSPMRMRSPKRVHIAIAKSLKPIEVTMDRWLVGLLVSSAMVFGLATILIRLALQSGLKPLDSLASDASEIDVNSLATRFDPDGMPKELRPIAETLNDLLARLEQNFDRERRVSADIAHELRTPVASLKSLGEVALKWPEQASNENYEDVCEISNRMAETIERMLLLARLEEGSVQPNSTSVELEDLLKKQCQSLSKSADEAEIGFEMELNEAPTLSTDPELLDIVVSNLLRNAIKHAPAKSRIRISCGKDGNLLAISNAAPNLEPEDLPHLFERFWKGDPSRSGNTNSGLGLSIARSAASVIKLTLTASLDRDQQVTFLVGESK